jgi:anaerobic magnesium-protoporphyrin IX monomethyl ester cyclase
MRSIYLLSPWCERRYRGPLSSLLYLKYFLADHGYDASIVDCSQGHEDYREVLQLLKGEYLPIVGITGYTRERFHAYRLIRAVRETCPDAYIVVGGRHFGALPEQTKLNLPVDEVVSGYGEVALLKIVDDLNGIHTGIDRANIDQFREYDPKDAEELPNQKILAPIFTDTQKYFVVRTSRGCINKCVFCVSGNIPIQFRSLDNVMTELEWKIATTGVRNVVFGDTSFTAYTRRTYEICDLIKPMGLRFSCYSRADVPEALLTKLREAGLIEVDLGMESGSQRVLDAVGKRITPTDVERTCRICHRLGVKVYLFVMVSLPSETMGDAMLTLNLVKKLTPFIAGLGVQVTRILPDSALDRMARENGCLPSDFSWFTPYTVPDEHKDLIKDDMCDHIPLYVEHLTPVQIRHLLAEYRKIVGKLVTSSYLWKAVKFSLKWEALRRTTPRKMLAKAFKLMKGLITIYQ